MQFKELLTLCVLYVNKDYIQHCCQTKELTYSDSGY